MDARKEPTDAMEEVELVDSRQAGTMGGSADDDTAEPDGELEEHAPLAGSGQDSAAFTQTKYISLDPNRRRSLGFETRKWLVPAAVAAIVLALTGSLLVWQAEGTRNLESPLPAMCTLPGGGDSASSLQPHAYNISLAFSDNNFDPDAAAADHTFVGNTSLSFTARQDRGSLVLHSVGLNFSAVAVAVDGGESLCLCGRGCETEGCDGIVTEASSGDGCPPTGLVSIELGESAMTAGQNGMLAMSYIGSLNPAHSGIYRSDVFNAATGDQTLEESVLLVTQLEQRGARHLFPCVDEPESKAVFTVALTYPAGFTALANTPVAAGPQAVDDDRLTQRHQPTPVMSTYLLAICIGHIVPRSIITDSGLNVTVWSVPRLQSQLQLPLQLAAKALEFYTNWTGIQQPLRKFDLVAVPGKQGAMENWGLLLFDETRFLWSEETAGAYGQWLSADVICHEVAHQWFGNLVTCLNWSHITVNEGMASFMEYLCIEAALPEIPAMAMLQRASSPMGMALLFLMREGIGIHEGPRATALLADDEPLTSAMVPEAAAQPRLFPSGAVEYSKGAAVLRMLQSFWEAGQPGSFQEGLQLYLNRHSYGSATVDDVIAALSAVSALKEELPEAAFALKMSQLARWFYQPGFPMLNVSLAAAQAGQVTVQQSRFLMWGGSSESEAPIEPWAVPMAIGAVSAPTAVEGRRNVTWLTLQEAAMTLPQQAVPADGAAWTVNSAGTGLFRAAYPPEHLHALAAAIRQLPANASGDRPDILAASALVEESFALLHLGVYEPSDVAALADAIAASPAASTPLGQHLLWGSLLDRLRMLRLLLLPNATCTQDFDTAISKLTANATAAAIKGIRSNANDTHFLSRLAQPDLLRDAALAGNSDAVAFLCEAFRNATNIPLTRGTPGFVHPDLRGAAYIAGVAQPPGCNVIQSAEGVWGVLRLRWEETYDIAEARRCLLALGYTEHPEAMQFTLDLLLDPEARVSGLLSIGASGKVPSTTDTIAVLRSLMRSRAGSALVWQYIRDRWEALRKRINVWSILEALPLLSTKQTREELQELLNAAGGDDLSVTQQKIVGRLEHDIAWVEHSGSAICDLLHARTH